ncbi:MAG: isochorismatase family cysteine hydrolase [Candidatus Woesearchaeota archaeon]
MLVTQINQLMKIVRMHNIPVIWVCQEYKPDASDIPLHDKKTGRRITIMGTKGAELLNGFNRMSADIILKKNRYNVFFKTNLDQIISEENIDTLVLAGINSHACIRMTAMDAFQRDMEVIIAKDCVSSWDKDHHNITLKYLENAVKIKVFSNSQIAEFLQHE